VERVSIGSGNGQAPSHHHSTTNLLNRLHIPAPEAWTRLLGSIYSNEGNSVSTTADESIYIMGYHEGSLDGQTERGNEDAVTRKHDIDFSNDPLNPTPVTKSGTITPYHSLIINSVGDSDKVDYLTFKILPNQKLTEITLTSYKSTDGKAFIGLQRGAQVTASAENQQPLIGYTHFGSGVSDAAVGTNLINKLGGVLTEGTYSIWIQQIGAKTDYSFDLKVEEGIPSGSGSVTITPSSTSINEGAVLTIKGATTNIKPGTTLYYSLSGTGINADDFSIGSLLGSAKVASNRSLSFSHTIMNDLKTEGDENLAIRLFSDSARINQVGSTASVVIRDTSPAPAFRNIGSVSPRAGTRAIDKMTGLGGEGVFAGAQNDILTGFSKISNDGNWKIPSFLLGGLGNDQYIISQGAFVVIADAGGGIDLVSAPSMNLNSTEFIRINQRDIYATDGNTSVLLIDPQGQEGASNKLENFVIGGKRYTLAQLTKLMLNSDSYVGDYTYQQLQRNGLINFQLLDLNPLSIDTYISDSIYNNSLVV